MIKKITFSCKLIQPSVTRLYDDDDADDVEYLQTEHVHTALVVQKNFVLIFII